MLAESHIVSCSIGKSPPVIMMIDSGADINVISTDDWNLIRRSQESNGVHIFDVKFNPEVNVKSYAASGNLNVVCTFKSNIRTTSANKPETFAEFAVIEGGQKSLLGRQTAIEMKLLAVGLQVNHVTKDKNEEFPSIPGVEIEFEIDEFVLPMRHAYASIPVHFRQAATERLESMQRSGIIEPAEGTPRWISGMSAVPKGRNDFRLVVNMRGPNKAIQRQYHQMPRVDEMQTKLNGAKFFTKLDLHSAFHHVKISERSRELTTFMAPTGLFRFKRLVFGVNCAPEIFQRLMEDILRGINSVIIYIDDILVFAPTLEELRSETQKVKLALERNNLTLNNEKCIYEVQSLTFLGHSLSERGLSIDEQKVKDIESFRRPKSSSELKSFLGLASYISSYIPHFADISQPLWKVVNDQHFSWGHEQTEAFNNVKRAIITCTTSQGFFDTTHETFLYTDASPHALGAVLTQKDKEGTFRIISFASKSLTPTEKRYPQTQREALAVVWAAERYFYYLLGQTFTIRTDAEGIAYIFKRNGNAPKKLMRRAEGWAMRLDLFDFKIEFVKGNSNIADPSSRLYEGTDEEYQEDKAPFEIGSITLDGPARMDFGEDHLPIMEVRYRTSLDETSKSVMKAMETGEWGAELSKYEAVKEELYEANGILMRGGLAIIPNSLREKALTLAHKGHPGMTKMKTILRERVWWPSMSGSVEEWVGSCRTCVLNGRKERPTPMERTKLPTAPWDFVAVDFCGPYSMFGGTLIVTMTDYYSRFLVAAAISSTDFSSTRKFFDQVFDQYGFPEAMKTDNGPPFNSKDYKEYCEDRGINPVFSWPLTPQQNGMAERGMQIINKAMQTASIENTDYRKTLAEAVRAQNTAVHRTTNVAPSDMMFSRKLRRALPLASSASYERNDEKVRSRDWDEKMKAKEREDKKRGAREARIMVGDKVVLRRAVKRKGDSNYDPNELEVVKKRKGDLTMATSDGRTIRRHVTLAKKILPAKSSKDAHGDNSSEPPDTSTTTRVLRPRNEIKKPVHLRNCEITRQEGTE